MGMTFFILQKKTFFCGEIPLKNVDKMSRYTLVDPLHSGHFCSHKRNNYQNMLKIFTINLIKLTLIMLLNHVSVKKYKSFMILNPFLF